MHLHHLLILLPLVLKHFPIRVNRSYATNNPQRHPCTRIRSSKWPDVLNFFLEKRMWKCNQYQYYIRKRLAVQYGHVEPKVNWDWNLSELDGMYVCVCVSVSFHIYVLYVDFRNNQMNKWRKISFITLEEEKPIIERMNRFNIYKIETKIIEWNDSIIILNDHLKCTYKTRLYGICFSQFDFFVCSRLSMFDVCASLQCQLSIFVIFANY